MMQTRKKLCSLCIVLVSVILITIHCPKSAYAGVEFTTDKNAEFLTVGIAGNPDWYPYESFNTETGEYEGLFPRLFELLSEKTELNFVYTDSGTEDHRLLNQKTGYAQIISAYKINNLEIRNYSMSNPVQIIEFEKDGWPIKIGFVFGKYAEPEVIEKINKAMETISANDISSILNTYLAEKAEENDDTLFYVVSVALGLCLIAIIFLVVRLIKRKHQLAEKIERETKTDHQTGVRNKAAFEADFKQLATKQQAAYILAYIGFDIQKVNKFYGEEKSEEELRFAAKILSNVATNEKYIARIAGGAFIMLHVCSTEIEAELFAKEQLFKLNKFAEQYESGYKPVFKIGIYRLPPTNWNYDNSLDIARTCYEIAQKIDVNYYIYNQETENQHHLEEILSRDFETALEEKQLVQFLQPIVDTQTGEIVLAEGLARWQHPEMGVINPARFLSLVIEKESIYNLDLYMFEESCRRLEIMQQQNKPYKLSTNFTRISISAADFCERIQSIADKYAFEKDKLIMEITEDCLESNKELALRNMNAMRAKGFSLALDDVGSKFSFFSDLQDYPIDYIKMDKSFLPKKDDFRAKTFVSNLIDTCKTLGIKTICEGVETKEQRNLVKEMGCDYIQGYYFYKPLAPEEYANTLK